MKWEPAGRRSAACPGNALAPFPESGAGCLFAAAPLRSGATVAGSGNAGGSAAGRRCALKSLCPRRALSCEFPPRGERAAFVLLKGSRHVNLLGPGAGGASCGAGAEGWQGPRGCPRRGGTHAALPMGGGLLGRPGGAGCSGVLLAGRLLACGCTPGGLRGDGGRLEPDGLATFLLGGGRLVLPSPKAPGDSQSPFHSLRCRRLPPADGAASASPAGAEVSAALPHRHGGRRSSCAVSWPCSGEGRVAPGRTAAPPPDCWHSSRTSLARCGRPHAAPSSRSAASPAPSRWGG